MVTKTASTSFELEESTMRKIIQEEVQNCVREKVREIINERLSNAGKQLNNMVTEAMDKLLPRPVEDRAVQSYDLVYDYLANNDGVNPLENFPFVAELDPECMDDAICARLSISSVRNNQFPKVPIVSQRNKDDEDGSIKIISHPVVKPMPETICQITHSDDCIAKQYAGKRVVCNGECVCSENSSNKTTAAECKLDDPYETNPEDDFKAYVMGNMETMETTTNMPILQACTYPPAMHTPGFLGLKRPQYEQMVFGKKTAGCIPVFKQFKEATDVDPSEIIGEFYNNKLKNLCIVIDGSCDCRDYANSKKSGVLPIDCVHTKFSASRRSTKN